MLAVTTTSDLEEVGDRRARPLPTVTLAVTTTTDLEEVGDLLVGPTEPFPSDLAAARVALRARVAREELFSS